MVVRKMKEKCKDAARMRREKERAEFVELSKLLPLPSSTTSQLDKASIIRLTSSYLRMREAFPQGLGENWGNNYHRSRRANKPQASANGQQQLDAGGQSVNSDLATPQQQQHQHQQVKELGSLILQTLDGFVFALHNDGKIMYISETASVHLGLPQIDLTGSSVFEYVHPSDHNDIYEILSLSEAEKSHLNSIATNQAIGSTHELGRSFCMRMKCILPKRNAGLVTSGYKAIHCSGYLKVRKVTCASAHVDYTSSTGIGENRKGISSISNVGSGCRRVEMRTSTSTADKSSSQDEWESYALVAVGHSLLPTASTEVKLTGNSFMFRANLDLKLYYIEATVIKLLGLEQVELIGQSLYQLIHVDDTIGLESSHKSLLEKGQVITKYYRLMKKDGGSIWVQSYATLVNNPRNMPKPQHIVSICFVLGENQLDKSRIFYTNHQYKTNPTNIKSCNGNLNNGALTILKSHQQQKMQRKLAPIKKCRKLKPTTNSISFLENNSSQHQLFQLHQQEQQVTLRHQDDSSKSTFSHNSSHSSVSSACSGSIGGSFNVNNIFIQQANNLCVCTLPSYPAQQATNNLTSIGSVRRASDDTCSVVSSVASTSVSSNCSSSQQTSDSLVSYTVVGDSANYTSDHFSAPNGVLYPTLDSPIKSSASISSSNEHLQQQASVSSGTVHYEEFNLHYIQSHSQTEHHHQQNDGIQMQRTSEGDLLSPCAVSSTQVGLTPKNFNIPVTDNLSTNTQLIDDQMVEFNQQPATNCNVTSQYFYQQPIPDWHLAQTNCSSLALNGEQRRQQHNPLPITGDNYHFNLVDDGNINSYGDTSMGSFLYHKSPSYLGVDNNGHYQQVTVNNVYTM